MTTNEERFSRDELKETVDALISPLLAQHEQLGLVVGLQIGDCSEVYGYGALDETRLTVPNERTLFELGSITKVFTALLLVTMVEEGLVSLDEPLRSLLPECPDLPQDITLLRLATHSSGLPGLPLHLFETPDCNPDNPYGHFTPAQLYAHLATARTVRHGRRSGTYVPWNLDAAVLGDVLGRKLGLSYEQALVQRICDPLGLPDTRSMLTAEQQERLAPPHTPTGEPTLNWDLPTLAGAAGLRSTAQDLLILLTTNLGSVSTPLQSALRLCRQIVVEHSLPQGSLPFGWHVSRPKEPGKALYWQNGATGGYRAFAGFRQESQSGVVVLSNYGPTAKIGIDRIGITLLDRLSFGERQTGCD